jgi:maltose/maltodextrin transport system substrate-binding protein
MKIGIGAASGVALLTLVVSAGEYEICNQVVRRGGVEGRPYWNGHAIMFMYPPAFDFKSVKGAVDYRFEVMDDVHVKHVFTAKEPTADLVSVWTNLPTGYVTVNVYGEDAAGRTLGLSGTRTFWKKATFKAGSYPKAKYGYDECAKMIYGYQFRSDDYQYTFRTGKLAQSFDTRYPAKMMSGLINGMVNYAELCPEKREDALKLARAAAKALIDLSEGPHAKYPYFAPTYNPVKYPANQEWPNRRRCMTIYPVFAAQAYLRLYEAVKETEYLELARHIADTFLAFQGEDGTWPLMINFDAGPIGKNRMIPIEAVEFFEHLFRVTGDQRYRVAGDRAFGYIEKNLIATWNWEGQFEDTPPTEHYRNLTKHPACSTAIYLLKRHPGDKAKRALARELLRFAEDLFVNWERPYDNGRRVPDQKKFTGYYNHFWKQDKWIMPSVFEQYGCYTPVDASAAKLIRTYLAFYRVEGNPLDLAKARALGDVATRCTSPDGLEATWWTEDELRFGVWPNCMLATASALHELASVK